MLKEYYRDAIPRELLESGDPRDQELVRIAKLAANGVCSFDYEKRTHEPFRLLACALLNLEPNFFSRTDHQMTEQLLGSAMREKAMLLTKFICSSKVGDSLKYTICGEVESFLKEVCQVRPDEIVALRNACSYDPTDGTHGIFAGLGPDGE